MILTLTAVGAVVAALLELTLWPYLVIGGAHPHPVLIYVVLGASVLGLDCGLVAAFVGGLTLDLVAPRPLGSSAFALLLAAGLSVAISRALDQFRYLAPVVAVFVLSLLYSMTIAILYSALKGPIALHDPLRELLPGAIYDAVIALLIGPLAVAFRIRRLERERVDW